MASTALSLIAGISAATDKESTYATIAYVNNKDEGVAQAIEAKGGSVPQLNCRGSGGGGTYATEAYVNACDKELYEAIEKIVSPYEVGNLLCGTSGDVCTDLGSAWGMVIYVDPNPIESGFNGIAMALNDRVNTGGTVVPYAEEALQNTEVNADNYGLYGGMANQQAYCDTTTPADADCTQPFNPTGDPTTSTSAFNACTTYQEATFLDWYLPSTAELMLMFEVAQQVTYGADAQPAFEYANPNFFVNFQGSVPYWSSSENNGFGSLGSPSSVPASQALLVSFASGFQVSNDKNNPLAVRCVRALPI